MLFIENDEFKTSYRIYLWYLNEGMISKEDLSIIQLSLIPLLALITVIWRDCFIKILISISVDLDFSIKLILIQGIVIAIVKNFNWILVSLALITVGDLISFQVVSHIVLENINLEHYKKRIFNINWLNNSWIHKVIFKISRPHFSSINFYQDKAPLLAKRFVNKVDTPIAFSNSL